MNCSFVMFRPSRTCTVSGAERLSRGQLLLYDCQISMQLLNAVHTHAHAAVPPAGPQLAEP